ncbi:GGDEF domain-containing protein, partial [Acinetobacter baumannii]|nr:GGDEF domain-containing protein [Acinetobacter baumannii]MDA0616817.1 GGDEF domain-containing protein [Acinetobacter baumannii]
MKLQGSNILGQEQIDLLTTRGLNFVWFPKQLETIYRFQYQNGAAYEFRYRAPIILILYLFLSFGIYQVLPTEQVLSWLSYYSWVGIIVLIAWILSFIKKLNQW